MDLRDDTHTQLKDHIATLRILAQQKPPSELVHNEITRWCEQAATVLETFVLPTIKPNPPYLDLRTGMLGNSQHKVAEYVGATSETARDEDEAPGFLRSNGNGVKA